MIGKSFWTLRDNAGNVYEEYTYTADTPGVEVFKVGFKSKPGDINSGYIFFEVPANHGAWMSLNYNDEVRDVTFNL